MTDDLIRRQELKNAMYHEAFETDTDLQKWDSGCWIRYKLFENVVDSLPSVERKKGKWIMINDHTAKCSRCHDRRWTSGHDYMMKGHIFYAMYKYCPECGVLMEADNDQ